MHDPENDDEAGIQLYSPTGDVKGHVPRSTSGPHSRAALVEQASLELAREPGQKTSAMPDIGMGPSSGEGAAVVGPGGKKIRPEQQAWAKDFVPPVDTRPKTPGGLELDHVSHATQKETLPPWELDRPGTQKPRISMKPTGKRPVVVEPPGPGKKIALGFGVVLLVVGVMVGYRFIDAQRNPLRASSPTPLVEDPFVRKMRAAAEGAPECWVGDDGFHFIYKGSGGDKLKAKRISDVPALYRRQAACVPESP